MLALYGMGVSEGITIGRAHVLQRERIEISEYVLPKHLVEEEVLRFEHAIAAAHAQLIDIRDQIPADAPAEAASFIDTHVLILQDKTIAQVPIEIIRTQQYNAEWALKVQSERLVEMFEQMDDPYLRERKTDVIHVVERVLRNLLQHDPDEEEQFAAGEIIVANDLTPADTVLLKHRKVHAFVTDMGGPISHTAILARSLGIPAVVSIHSAMRYIRSGDQLIVDGTHGVLIVAPDRAAIAEYRRRLKSLRQERKELARLRTSSMVTRDRRRIQLMANIELPGDVKAALQAHAAGIGLYRTEFLFMNRTGIPSEEEQYRAYTKVARAMHGKPVTIRTLDLGADKQVDGGRASGPVSVNPALGLRAVRLCLHDTSLFKPQLRAILRASVHGNVQLMIPMLSGMDELFRVLELIDEVKRDLKRAGQRFNKRMLVGGMIEVPAAAVSADMFASYLDFFSIGTNDLIQYTLAIDRVDDAVNYLYDPLHPAVLRLIDITLRAGQRARIPVAMCGEMAGDPRYTRLLLGMGLTEFSMHPATLLTVKKIVRESSVKTLARQVKKLMQEPDSGKLRDLAAAMA